MVFDYITVDRQYDMALPLILFNFMLDRLGLFCVTW